ncbi:MAG: ATP synthase F0 subunit B, partial [candidate division WS1 bacterium]|nr:ATP synthase F0 subunit B [candidate division WS1 bacterium]
MASVLDQLGIQGGALLVNIVGFLLLLYLMRRVAFKPVGDFMQQRADRIKADLTEARQLRD